MLRSPNTTLTSLWEGGSRAARGGRAESREKPPYQGLPVRRPLNGGVWEVSWEVPWLAWEDERGTVSLSAALSRKLLILMW